MEILPDIRLRGVGRIVYWETVTIRGYTLNNPTCEIRIVLVSSGTLERRTANFCTKVASKPVLPQIELTGSVRLELPYRWGLEAHALRDHTLVGPL